MFGLLFRIVRFVVTIAVVAFVVMQLVPYRLTKPPERTEPKWDSERTRSLVVAACYDCHSNETTRHWYTQIAPVSWATVKEVRKGRAALNFSEWKTSPHPPAVAVAETVSDGSMPPSWYTWFGFHKHADLTKQERAELIAGLRKTLGAP